MFYLEGRGDEVVKSQDGMTVSRFIDDPVGVFMVEAHSSHVVNEDGD